MDYELTFVVSGASVDDDDAVEAMEALDAMLFRGAGVDLLTLTATGDDAVTAARQAATNAVNAIPRLHVHRLDHGLVGIHEIAERTGRSRQNVTQWANGHRRADAEPFPSPVGTAGRSRVWLWSEVNAWLRQIGLDDGLQYPTRAEMTLIDYALLTMHTVTVTFDSPDDEFAEERQQVEAEIGRTDSVDLLRKLADRTSTLDSQGRHVVVIAGQSEPAAAVMERIAAYGHDVVLMTRTDRLLAVVLSTKPAPKPKGLVPVPLTATIREWVELMWNHPNAAFMLSSTGQATPKEVVFRDAA